MLQPRRLFPVASEHSYGESLSVISTSSSLFQVKCCKDVGCVSYHVGLAAPALYRNDPK